MREKKEYKVNDNLSMRLTAKAGVTEEVIDFLNELDDGKRAQEIIKAIKYWKLTEEKADRMRKDVEREAIEMDRFFVNRGKNRGPYKKSGKEPIEDKIIIKEKTLKKTSKPSIVTNKEPLVEPSEKHDQVQPMENKEVHMTNATSAYEDELFGNAAPEKKKGNPMQRALSSIPRQG